MTDKNRKDSLTPHKTFTTLLQIENFLTKVTKVNKTILLMNTISSLRKTNRR